MLATCWNLVTRAIVLSTVATLTLGMTAFAPPGDPQTLPGAQVLSTIVEDSIATAVFQQRVSDYVMLHRLLEGPLPTLKVSTDMRTVQAAMDALARQIQAARTDARQGDIFTVAVARMFHRRIATCLAREELNAILAEPHRGGAQATPRVNEVWPITVPFDFVPPQILATLPHLPPELQYRIIGRSLVLWDHHANLIVDVLPGSLATEGV